MKAFFRLLVHLVMLHSIWNKKRPCSQKACFLQHKPRGQATTHGPNLGPEQVNPLQGLWEGWLQSVPSLPTAPENTWYDSPPADCVKEKWAMALPLFNPFKASRHPRQLQCYQALSRSELCPAHIVIPYSLPMSHTKGCVKSSPQQYTTVLVKIGVFTSQRFSFELQSKSSTKSCFFT